MQKVTFNDKGEIIEEETGRVIGKRDASGKAVFNTPSTSTAPSPAPAPLPRPGRETNSYTKYEVRPDSEFSVKFCLGFKDERIVVYTEEAYLKLEGLERHQVTFRMWKYEEELSWKNQCMEFDPQTRSFKLNQTKLDELKIRNLIKEWSFSEIDPKFKLLHVNKVLSDESYDVFKGFFPTIINNIIFLMNQVLENNG